MKFNKNICSLIASVLFGSFSFSMYSTDSIKIKEIQIIACYFDKEAKFDFGVNEMKKVTGCYNRILEKKDAVDLEKKVSALLSIDTASSGYYDYSKLDLRHLITLKYGENISSIWIGFSRSGLMFVNGKIFKRDDLILKEISKYILDKRLNKNIRKYIKMWNEPKK